MMKLSLLLSLILFISTSASATPVPRDPCGGLHKECTPWMKDLYVDFHAADDLIPVPAAYTGHCHYHAVQYGSDHRHYAALLLEVDESNQMYFNGTFAFFAPEDRFDDWTLESARERVSNPWSHPMTSFGDHSMADYMPDGGLWKFWVSQNPETLELYLISYWGFHQRGFCRFTMADDQ